MKRFMFGLLLLSITGATASKALAWGSDFTKDQIATAGKHCVHGFWVNQQTVVFYAGDAFLLNREFSKCLEGEFALRKVVIHVGTKKAESPWDTKARDTFADWSVNTNTWDDPADAAKAVPRMQLQIDIWLGSKIKLEDLRIPEEFEVVSDGEIERFIKKAKATVQVTVAQGGQPERRIGWLLKSKALGRRRVPLVVTA